MTMFGTEILILWWPAPPVLVAVESAARDGVTISAGLADAVIISASTT